MNNASEVLIDFRKLGKIYITFLNDTKILIVLFSLISLEGSVQLPKTFQVKSWDDKVIIAHLKEQYDARILDGDIIIIMVMGNVMPTGTILEDTESKSYAVLFDVIAFTPKILEILRGEVMEVTDFGMIVRIGPVDAYVHQSQIFDGYGKINVQTMQIVSRNGRTITVGTTVRGQITSNSIMKTGGIKIGMTCKEPDFGPELK